MDGEADLASIIRRIRDGDQSAARELLARYEAQVRLVVRRQLPRLLRSRFDSLDFLQSVWGSFFRQVQLGPDEFEQPHALVAFLAQVARHKVIDEYRRASSRKADRNREVPLGQENGAFPELVSAEDTPSALVEAGETLQRLRDLLPEHRRAVVEMRVEGLSTREIGERLNLSERTIRRTLEDLRRRADEGAEETNLPPDRAGGRP